MHGDHLVTNVQSFRPGHVVNLARRYPPGAPLYAVQPLTSTMTLSNSAKQAEEGEWMVAQMVVPSSAASCFTTTITSCAVKLSRPEVGSSWGRAGRAGRVSQQVMLQTLCACGQVARGEVKTQRNMCKANRECRVKGPGQAEQEEREERLTHSDSLC